MWDPSKEERSSRKLELLNHLLREEGARSAGPPAVARRANLLEFPVSFAQKRLWFLNQLEPGSHYNDHFNLRLRGPLQVDALQWCLGEIMRRHEALRAIFIGQRGELVQRIAPPAPLPLPFTDLSSLAERGREDGARGATRPTSFEHPSALDEDERLEQARELAVAAARAPFDLERGPLLRVHLVRLGEQDHLLILAVHHIAIDGWSRGVFLRELTALYPARLACQPSFLPEPPIQYADFALWQRQWMQDGALSGQLAYWKKQLNGAPALLEWPASFARPEVASFRGARQGLALGKDLTGSLKALSQGEGCTLFMTLLAAFQTLAARLTGQTDIVMGTPIANRTRAEVEGLIGVFLNTLVLRADLSGDPTFREALSRVREMALGAYAHQDLPFERLVEELNPARRQGYHPIFQVMFIFQNAPRPVLQAGGLSLSPFEIDSGTAKFDLTLNLEETGDGLAGWIEYTTDLFTAEAITRLRGQYKTLLEGVVAQPDLPISKLPLLAPEEKHLVLGGWNNSRAEYPRERCIHELFEKQAARAPGATAVVCGERQWTYGELDARANRLARRLLGCGVRPGVLAGIGVERSLEMVAGILAVLKAGGAYLPLDPAQPRERLRLIVEDAQPAVLLTQEHLVEWAGQLSRPEEEGAATKKKPVVICVDSEGGAIDGEADGFQSEVSPQYLAYVIHTSGSTGKPKGVQIGHHAVVNFLESMRREPGLTARDTLLAITTLSFDIAGLEIWLPLTTGARVVIARREEILDGPRLAELIINSGATIMQATPATWNFLLESGWKGSPQLKVLCGGEAWPPKLAEGLLEKCGSLWNMYGPTETTIWSAVSRIEPGGEVLIGKAIDNTQFYILDEYRQPVPVGVAGELHIAGEGLARGYLNSPELTAQKFIPDPFSDEPGARLYKTGDRARFKEDGRIEFLGRMDHQVKIRGFRVELGEIESVLRDHPAVGEAVVLAREDPPRNQCLAAYVTARGKAKPALQELREHVKAKLPDYMTPSFFIVLEKFPLSPNGKVDRKALPAPPEQRAELAASHTPPRDATEKALAGIWAEALGLERVGTHDNFFDLGGHSLMLMRVHVKICETLNTHVSIVKLFQYPTISSLARHLNGPAAETAPMGKIRDRARLQREALVRREQAFGN